MTIALPDDWAACERGNTWLVQADPAGDNHVAWFDLPGSAARIEVSLVPGNYPGLEVQVCTFSDEALAYHINGLLADGWEARKCNVPGVVLPADR